MRAFQRSGDALTDAGIRVAAVPVDDEAGASGGQAEVLAQLSGGQRGAVALGAHDGDECLQVGGLQLVQCREGVAEPRRVRAVAAQGIDDVPPDAGLAFSGIEAIHLLASSPPA